MIPYDKYGAPTLEFRSYQQAAYDDLRARAEAYTAQAIKDGVCPEAVLSSMRAAISSGSNFACAVARTKDRFHESPAGPWCVSDN